MPTNHRLVSFIPQGTMMQENNKITVFSPGTFKKKKVKVYFLKSNNYIRYCQQSYNSQSKFFWIYCRKQNKISDSTFNLHFNLLWLFFSLFDRVYFQHPLNTTQGLQHPKERHIQILRVVLLPAQYQVEIKTSNEISLHTC